MSGDDSLRRHFAREHSLVTGGAGAIGSNLVRALLGFGSTVTVLDDLSSGSASNVAGLDIEFVKGDVRSVADIARAFRTSPRYVFHLAAHFANRNSVDHPVADGMTNAIGTLQLLEAAKQVAGLHRFVYASSSCVLGQQDEVLDESSCFRPETPYGVSKLAGEMYARMYPRLYGLPVTCVRYFNVFGPGERPGPYRNVLPNFVARALRGEPLVITGTGEETREFVFVADAVRGTLLAATSDHRMGGLYHLGSGHVLSIRELAERVVAATGSNVPIDYVPRRSWDTLVTRRTNSEKAAGDLGYAARVSFDDGLAATVGWLREQDLTEIISG